MSLPADRVKPAPDLQPIFDGAAFDQALTSDAQSVAIYREALKTGSQRLAERFRAGIPVTELVTARARLIDELLRRTWRTHQLGERSDIALIAVGGYGRGELHPGSDIDLLILLQRNDHERYRAAIEGFLMFLWDIGLEVGQSVRSLEDCVHEAEQDITVATNLIEARLLTGPKPLFEAMRGATGPEHLWSSKDFFEAKCEEQRARHLKLDDTAYNLEPNIKESPGGLRDIQMVGWVAKRHFGTDTLRGLVDHDFLTESEYQTLMEGQAFLWRIRFALHILTGRREDRLLFDYQRTLAQDFGYRDREHVLDVEQFMQDYYQSVMALGRLNEMLLQFFREAILYGGKVSDCVPVNYVGQAGACVPINKRFRAINGFLEVTDAKVFRRYPLALLEIFLILEQNPKLEGVRASTIRLIRDHRHLIDEDFRNELGARSLFMEILRQPRGVAHELRRMHSYGILAAYLPVFAKIVGRMQYDLFHVYSVDEHTLFVLRNLRRMAVPAFAQELPFCSERMGEIPKPELLYIAALFHDIAKGRGGDHSEEGALEAQAFCRHHDLNRYDTRLITWLVGDHLLMSITAQRKDISDPKVIHAFAAHVGNLYRLDYLYLLTVADIRATNPSLWNSWKDALLKELYFATKQALRRGLENPIEKDEMVAEVQEGSRELLTQMGCKREKIARVWQEFNDDYFMRYSANEIVCHTQAVAHATPADIPLVLIRKHTERGGTEVFVYAENHNGLFAQIASVLDRLHLTIVDARIITSQNGHSLDSFLVLEDSGEPINNHDRGKEILTTLRQQLLSPNQSPVAVSRRVPRQHKHFPIATDIKFIQDERNGRTVLELTTTDRPGLLSQVGRALTECNLQVHNAKVATFGTRAEDIFLLTNAEGRLITAQEDLDCLRERILQNLGEA